MNERRAKTIAHVFATVSAAGVPFASFVNMAPLNPTLFAGAALVMIYFAANPQLLVVSRSQYEEAVRRGLIIPSALVLGATLMVIGAIQSVIH
jgi:hypothetical protein